MWAFFSRRLRMWLILAIGVPVLAWLLGRIGDVIESRKGPNGVSRSLQKARGWLRAHGAGPFARRGTEAERTR
jgi:hypothetical protein